MTDRAEIAGSQDNNSQLIDDDYFHFVGRSADADGLAFWLQQFADGQSNEDVIAGFTGQQSITPPRSSLPGWLRIRSS